MWREAVRFRKISRELEPLVRSAHASLVRPDLPSLRNSLIELTAFLAGDGRSDANCCATDAFFSRIDGADIERLPADYQKLIALLGGALHDAVYAPHIAATFDSLPEQLLEQARALS